jgi:hypothetical protein
VLAVIDSCFEEWLVEAADEVEVFGLAFRRRENLPKTTRTTRTTRTHRAPEATPAAAFSPHPAT